MTALKSFDIVHYGDAAWLIRYDVDGFHPKISQRIQAMARVLSETDTHKVWEDIVPGYDSLLITFNPYIIRADQAKSKILSAVKSVRVNHAPPPDTIDIPVCYGGVYGPDIDTICAATGLTKTALIQTHSQAPYQVCMMGFIPGFTFLSAAPDILHHPRHATPRLSVAAGSVGIAGWQTGIYGLESPGGWQIIGRTPLSIFDAERKTPFFIEAGQYVRFIPISEAEFKDFDHD